MGVVGVGVCVCGGGVCMWWGWGWGWGRVGRVIVNGVSAQRDHARLKAVLHGGGQSGVMMGVLELGVECASGSRPAQSSPAGWVKAGGRVNSRVMGWMRGDGCGWVGGWDGWVRLVGCSHMDGVGRLFCAETLATLTA